MATMECEVDAISHSFASSNLFTFHIRDQHTQSWGRLDRVRSEMRRKRVFNESYRIAPEACGGPRGDQEHTSQG
jgi:hypothetical protein